MNRRHAIPLRELEAFFLQRIDDSNFRILDDKIEGADGIQFVCPKCYVDNGSNRPGVHSVICWRPNVPQTTTPVPGRWEFEGAGLDDLTLVAGSSSILLLPPSCGWHGYIRSGQATLS